MWRNLRGGGLNKGFYPLSRFFNGREPSPKRAQEFLDNLSAGGSKLRSIRRHAAALKGYFEFLGTPIMLRVPKVTKKLPKGLTKEEVDKLIAKAEFPHGRAIGFCRLSASYL
jgi:site-specific recombinase XerD